MFKHVDFWFEESLNLKGRIALVGSSSHLLGMKAANLINEFDTVIRFNRAPVDGHEKFVGSKTTHRVVNPHVFKNMAIDERFTNQPQYFVRDLRDTHLVLIGPGAPGYKDRLEFMHESNKLSRFKFSMVNDLKNIARYGDGSNPSVGYIMLCICVAANIKPTVFGFDYDKSGDPTKRNHYWEDRPPVSGLHKVSYEVNFLNQLNDSKKIDIYKE